MGANLDHVSGFLSADVNLTPDGSIWEASFRSDQQPPHSLPSELLRSDIARRALGQFGRIEDRSSA